MTRDDVWVGRGFMRGDKLLRVRRVMARWFELEDGSKWCADDWKPSPKKGRAWMEPCLRTYDDWLASKVLWSWDAMRVLKMNEAELVQLKEVLDRVKARLEGGGK